MKEAEAKKMVCEAAQVALRVHEERDAERWARVNGRMEGMLQSLDTIIRGQAKEREKAIAAAPKPAPRLCCNCTHARRPLLTGWQFARCNRPNTTNEEYLVHGKSSAFCSVERGSEISTRCGPGGQFFELKPLSFYAD